MENEKKWMFKTQKEGEVRLSMADEEFIKQGNEGKKIIDIITTRTEKIVKEAEERLENFERKLKEKRDLRT